MTDSSLPYIYPVCLKCLETKVKQALRKQKVKCQTCRKEEKRAHIFNEKELKLEAVAKRLRDLEKEKPTCTFHPVETITHYCSKCDEHICAKCVSEFHDDHRLYGVDTLEDSALKLECELANSVYNRQYEVSKSIENMKNGWAKLKMDTGACKETNSLDDAGRRETEKMKGGWPNKFYLQQLSEWEEENKILSEKVKEQGRWMPREVKLDH